MTNQLITQWLLIDYSLTDVIYNPDCFSFFRFNSGIILLWLKMKRIWVYLNEYNHRKFLLSYLLFFAIHFGIRTGSLLAPTWLTLALFISPRRTRRITVKARASLEQMFWYKRIKNMLSCSKFNFALILFAKTSGSRIVTYHNLNLFVDKPLSGRVKKDKSTWVIKKIARILSLFTDFLYFPGKWSVDRLTDSLLPRMITLFTFLYLLNILCTVTSPLRSKNVLETFVQMSKQEGVICRLQVADSRFLFLKIGLNRSSNSDLQPANYTLRE